MTRHKRDWPNEGRWTRCGRLVATLPGRAVEHWRFVTCRSCLRARKPRVPFSRLMTMLTDAMARVEGEG